MQTRDGRVVLFNLKKCEESVQRLAADLGPDVSVDRVVQEAMRTIFDGIPTTQIERSLVLAAAAFIEHDPAYSFLAARLQLEALFKEVTGQSLSASPEERDAAYRMSFRIAIRNGLDTSLLRRAPPRASTSTRWPRRSSRNATGCSSISASRRSPIATWRVMTAARSRCRRRSGCASRWASRSTSRIARAARSSSTT